MSHTQHSESVRYLIDRQAMGNPQAPYLLLPESDEILSFAQLQQHVQAVARFIDSCDVAMGSSVAYAMSNDRHCVLALLGIMYGGYRAVA
ncbi:hypothetical protein N9383_07290, partial [Granulosicoccus sp.]|nr:hypothetical protein [Granulosicoccus sp.]